MKSASACLICAALLLAISPTACCAALDELEDLLNLDTTPPQDDLTPSPLLPGSPAGPTFDYRNWAEPDSSAARSMVSPSVPAATPASGAAEIKPASPVNAVPEPSAWLLAAAALLYFAIFGRRRRLA